MVDLENFQILSCVLVTLLWFNEHCILKFWGWADEMGSVFAFMPHCTALNLLQIAFENEGQKCNRGFLTYENIYFCMYFPLQLYFYDKFHEMQ